MPRRRSPGEGTLFRDKKRGLWVAKITLPGGRCRRKTSREQRVVRDWLIAQRDLAAKGLLAPDEALTVGAFLDRYLADVAAHSLRPKTLEA